MNLLDAWDGPQQSHRLGPTSTRDQRLHVLLHGWGDLVHPRPSHLDQHMHLLACGEACLVDRDLCLAQQAVVSFSLLGCRLGEQLGCLRLQGCTHNSSGGTRLRGRDLHLCCLLAHLRIAGHSGRAGLEEELFAWVELCLECRLFTLGESGEQGCGGRDQVPFRDQRKVAGGLPGVLAVVQAGLLRRCSLLALVPGPARR